MTAAATGTTATLAAMTTATTAGSTTAATATTTATTTTAASATTAAATAVPTGPPMRAHGRETFGERNLEFGLWFGCVVEVRHRDARQGFADRALDGLQI